MSQKRRNFKIQEGQAAPGLLRLKSAINGHLLKQNYFYIFEMAFVRKRQSGYLGNRGVRLLLAFLVASLKFKKTRTRLFLNTRIFIAERPFHRPGQSFFGAVFW
jgi:hypothetical protein